MPTLQGALSEFVDAIAAIDGINHAPDEPSELVSAYPAAMTYGDSGELATMYPAGMSIILHSAQIALVMPLNGDLKRATRTMLPLIEPVYHAILTHRDSRTSAHYNTFAGINHIMGPLEWGGETMYGVIFTISGIKIENSYE